MKITVIYEVEGDTDAPVEDIELAFREAIPGVIDLPNEKAIFCNSATVTISGYKKIERE